MKSRAELLAELEEKSHKNKQLEARADELQISEPELAAGYDPYDNPGIHKVADIDDTPCRRSGLLRQRRR